MKCTIKANGAVSANGTGEYTFTFGIPFKSVDNMFAVGLAQGSGDTCFPDIDYSSSDRTKVRVRTFNDAGSTTDCDPVNLIIFGELENE